MQVVWNAFLKNFPIIQKIRFCPQQRNIPGRPLLQLDFHRLLKYIYLFSLPPKLLNSTAAQLFTSFEQDEP